MIKIAAVLTAATLALGACGSDSDSPDPSDFHNMETLSTSVQGKVNESLAEEGQDYTLDEVMCIEDGDSKATCLGTYSDGETETVEAVISEDGQSWITR